MFIFLPNIQAVNHKHIIRMINIRMMPFNITCESYCRDFIKHFDTLDPQGYFRIDAAQLTQLIKNGNINNTILCPHCIDEIVKILSNS